MQYAWILLLLGVATIRAELTESKDCEIDGGANWICWSASELCTTEGNVDIRRQQDKDGYNCDRTCALRYVESQEQMLPSCQRVGPNGPNGESGELLGEEWYACYEAADQCPKVDSDQCIISHGSKECWKCKPTDNVDTTTINKVTTLSGTPCANGSICALIHNVTEKTRPWCHTTSGQWEFCYGDAATDKDCWFQADECVTLRGCWKDACTSNTMWEQSITKATTASGTNCTDKCQQGDRQRPWCLAPAEGVGQKDCYYADSDCERAEYCVVPVRGSECWRPDCTGQHFNDGAIVKSTAIDGTPCDNGKTCSFGGSLLPGCWTTSPVDDDIWKYCYEKHDNPDNRCMLQADDCVLPGGCWKDACSYWPNVNRTSLSKTTAEAGNCSPDYCNPPDKDSSAPWCTNEDNTATELCYYPESDCTRAQQYCVISAGGKECWKDECTRGTVNPQTFLKNTTILGEECWSNICLAPTITKLQPWCYTESSAGVKPRDRAFGYCYYPESECS